MNPDSSDRSLRSRRQVLGAIAGAGLSVALAGCAGGSGGSDGTATGSTTTTAQETSARSTVVTSDQATAPTTVREETTTETETTTPETETPTETSLATQMTTGTTTARSTEGPCPSPPGPDTDPKTLLPEPSSGWWLDSEHSEAAGMVGAEVGYSGQYISPDGGEYSVEILRRPSVEDAEDGILMYRGGEDSSWTVRLQLGRFTFGVGGVDVEAAQTLLGASPAATVACVEEQGKTS